MPFQCPPEVQASLRRLSQTTSVLLLALAALGVPLVAQSPVTRPLATVDGVAISEDDVDRVVGSVVWPLEDRLYQIRKQAVEALIQQRLLEREAARRKISLQSLIDTEVTAKVKPVTDDEIDQVKAKSDTVCLTRRHSQGAAERQGRRRVDALRRHARTKRRRSPVARSAAGAPGDARNRGGTSKSRRCPGADRRVHRLPLFALPGS